MRKRNLLLTVTAAISVTMISSVTVYAGQWISDGSIWKYLNDDGSFSTSCWQWIDGNHDGIAECYYFGADGTMFISTNVEGYDVNADGAWAEGGEVQFMILDDQSDHSYQPGQSEQPESNFAEDHLRLLDDIQDEDGSSFTVDDKISANDTADISGYAYEVFKLVNQEREANGKSTLSWSDDLARCAQIRAEEQPELFEHIRPDGRSWSSVLSDNEIYYRLAGENLAYGQKDPKSVVDAWMLSPGHRENILKDKYEWIGVGCCSYNGVLYWAQLFMQRISW